MAAFEYKALDQKGKQKKGVIEADSARQVRQQLREKGLAPLEVEMSTEKKGTTSGSGSRRRLSVKELALLTRQIATLIQSGIPIEETLSAVASQSEKTNPPTMEACELQNKLSFRLRVRRDAIKPENKSKFSLQPKL